MKIIDVPVFEEDGSIKFTQSISPEEAKALLTFSLNFLTAQGMNVFNSIDDTEEMRFDD